VTPLYRQQAGKASSASSIPISQKIETFAIKQINFAGNEVGFIEEFQINARKEYVKNTVFSPYNAI
jgi:hypothetical protein